MNLNLPEDDPVLLTNVAAALRWAGRWTDAEDLHYAALRGAMNHAPAWMGLGQIAEDLGHWDKAVRCYLNAWNLATGIGPTVLVHVMADKMREIPARIPDGLPLQADVQNIALALSTAWMRLGNQDSLTRDLWAFGRFRQSWSPLPGVALWNPETPPPERLLILHEGGLGDQFWLAAFAPCDSGVSCPDTLTETLQGLSGFTWVKFLGEELEPGDWDAQAPLQALTTCALNQIREYGGWDARPKRPWVGRVGLCWTAEETGSQVHVRGIPPAELQSLQGVGVEWVNLTLSTELPWTGQVTKGWPKLKDVIESLDLVVTCDTAVLHLAGVLGVPTLALLPLRSNWMWLTTEQNPTCLDGGEGTVWYKSVELLRARGAWGWADVVGKVKKKLEGLCG